MGILPTKRHFPCQHFPCIYIGSMQEWILKWLGQTRGQPAEILQVHTEKGIYSYGNRGRAYNHRDGNNERRKFIFNFQDEFEYLLG